MKKLTVILMFLLFGWAGVQAQNRMGNNKPKSKPMMHQRMMNMSAEEHASVMDSMLTKKLALTKEQQEALASVNKEYAEKMKSNMDEMKALRDKMQATHDEWHEKIKGELTAAQQEKFDAMRERNHDRMQDRQQQCDCAKCKKMSKDAKAPKGPKPPKN